ncbi:MAG: 2-oxo acid dehydrogenase subunit E2 [Anaerolineae bacterium]|nr:2-oxo acid dehydrogenase subunit E2 [Anaerolineae bacterium]
MPKLGLTMTEGKILAWYKTEGETVQAGEPLLNVETDKVALDVEAPASGTLLKILYPAGDAAIPLETVIAYIGDKGETLPTLQSKASQTLTARSPESEYTVATAGATSSDAPIKISPLAKKLALEHQIDWETLKGSGPQGRIVEADILQTIEQKKNSSPLTSPSTSPETQAGQPIPYRVIGLNQTRRVSAQRMTESYQTIPHFYLRKEIVLARLVELRNYLLPEFEKKLGLHLTYTDFFLRALAMTLPKHPLMNASWKDGEIHSYTTINTGIAIATQRGLVVGVIHSIEKLPLEEIVRKRALLAEKARQAKLEWNDISNATFTLTNLGSFGVDDFDPIINPPQAAILACGAIAERPIADAGKITLQPTMRLCLAVDHRVADGADAAAFMSDLCELLVSLQGMRNP